MYTNNVLPDVLLSITGHLAHETISILGGVINFHCLLYISQFYVSNGFHVCNALSLLCDNSPCSILILTLICVSRSLNFITAVCVIRTPPVFALPTEDAPVWITEIECNRNSQRIESCPYVGFGVDSCPRIAGEVICVKRMLLCLLGMLTERHIACK